MNDFVSGRPPRPWDFYPSSDPTEPTPPRAEAYRQDGPWKNFGASSMNAISFGFVATAILISMFLIMAILEHLFRPNILSQDGSLESGLAEKSRNHDMLMTPYTTDFSVVMPGQKYPTCIALPAPLVPCPREGFRWPSHERTFPFS